MPVYGGAVERFEQINWSNILQDSQDLEPATRTITAVAEASGVGSADYSKSLTVPAAPDPRLVVLRIAARLAVTIDSLSAGASLRCRVYVDAQDADHLLFDKTWAASGAQLGAVDTTSSENATIFGLLKDGAAHTFYFFFWKTAAGAGDTVLSLVRLWEAVGSCTTDYQTPCLRIAHSGLAEVALSSGITGTGAQYLRLRPASLGTGGGYASTEANRLVMLNGGDLCAFGTVATDINWIRHVYLTLRSES